MKGRAVFIGRQDTLDGLPPIALFNVEWAGNALDGSTVGIKTIERLGLRTLTDRQGRKLLAVPAPVKAV